MNVIYDLIIIGAGPAGLSAAIYAGRAKLNTLVFEANTEGGQIVNTSEIANYPGGLHDDSGQSLVDRMLKQAEDFGAQIVRENVTEVSLDCDPKLIVCGDHEYYADAVVIATGARHAMIGCPGEERLAGAGVSYCATCDGPFFEGLPVYVVGGGDAAVEEAIYLTRFASEVYIIHRRDELRAAKSIQEKAFADPKIKLLLSCVVEEIKGEDFVESMVIRSLKLNRSVEVTGPFGLFVFVGFKPNSALFEGQLEMERGYIKTDSEMRTSIPGVFAAGDIRVKSLRQVVTAAADGAVAAVSAERYIDSLSE